MMQAATRRYPILTMHGAISHRVSTDSWSGAGAAALNGMTVRNWLAGPNFSTQYEFGINVIKMFM